MTPLERKYFEEVYKDRLENSVVFSKPSVRGFWKNIVEKYSDQAHFIYELLQNADDVNATSVSFELYRDQLVFRHNGTRHFSVTNPKTEDIDSENGTLGDINSITAIANSNKNNQSTIGKFGVGFKAVFLYTESPIIYDPGFAFRLNNYIVPVMEAGDYPGRKSDETIFVFPFNHPGKKPAEAFENISIKLQSLVFPQLFLNHIENISFTIGTKQGQYVKKIQSSYNYEDTRIDKVRLVYKDNETKDVREDLLWLCSRELENGNRYCVGFFHNSKGTLMPKDYPAFCFFPTKEKTGLHFIFHAPFLLTDSREGIQAGLSHNRNMIDLLAKLAAQSLVYLRDLGLSQGKQIISKNLFSVIPYREKDFVSLDNRDTISFKPFYLEILKILKQEKILPTSEGYVRCYNAHWANTSQTSDVFSNKQLQQLMSSDEAQWIDIGSGYQNCRATNVPLLDYLSGQLYIDELSEDDLLELIDEEFISCQERKWLLAFYKFIAANKDRVDAIRYKPIFIDSTGTPSAAFKQDHGSQGVLFLPSEGITGFRTIDNDLARQKETIVLAKALEIKEPSLKEEIYNVILPLFDLDEIPDAGPNFVKLFKYYSMCSRNEANEFIRLIADKYILFCHLMDSEEDYLGKPNECYLPSKDDEIYLRMLDQVWIVDLECYKNYGLQDGEELRDFLYALGVKKQPGLEVLHLREGSEYNGSYIGNFSMLKYAAPGTEWNRSSGTYFSSWDLPTIPGIEESLNYILEKGSHDCSVYIWNMLLGIANKCSYFYSYNSVFEGTYKYFYRTDKVQSFETKLPGLLRSSRWLATKGGDFVAPENAILDDLAPIYDLSAKYSSELVEFLHIQVDEDAPEENLSKKQKELLVIGKAFTDAGYSAKDIPSLLNRLKDLKEEGGAEKIPAEEKCVPKPDSKGVHSHKEPVVASQRFPSSDSTPMGKVLNDIWEISQKSVPEEPQKNVISGSGKNQIASIEDLEQFLAEDEKADTDEFIKPSVDYEKKIIHAKEKSAEALTLISQTQEYDRIAEEAPRYTRAWFNALLNLEIINSNQNSSGKHNITISFGKVRRESLNNRTLILEHPDRYIPQNIEDISDVAMILRGDSFEKLVAIEVVNIRSYTLRVKLKNLDQIADIVLSAVREATISIQNPVFILEELKKAFDKLPLADTDNLQQKLCSNIRFVFGPPGTGKTTYLAKDVIIPLMNYSDHCKVLVLTPTNKAADVLTARVIDSVFSEKYSPWLIRFGITGDERIERSGVFKEKTVDIRKYDRCVVVTTIARFPYDFFMPGDGVRLSLSEINWDYIVIDEASMIPLINIIYPLYKKTPKQFIIAGDPFQIEPITAVKQWKNENIYTMTRLNSFASQPKTCPQDYPVERLMTQYRSIPTIGTVFSQFAYGGILKHHRQEKDQKLLVLGPDLSVSSLNIVKFPTSKYESIYRPKKLNQSNYQIYSALFTYEFSRFMAERINKNHPGNEFSIGIVAPYRAEADLIEKLVNTIKLPPRIHIQAGTIHGFQGDECDIVMVVLNAPPRISDSPEMFLNKKNIINVAISRAKDYLFLIMPDDNTENINNLRLVKKVEALCRVRNSSCKCFTAEELERVMFSQPDFIELNSFSTGHQSVNVYGLPEMKYEIRSEDTAIDVQIHEKIEPAVSESVPVAAAEPEAAASADEPAPGKAGQADLSQVIFTDNPGPGPERGKSNPDTYEIITRINRKFCPYDHSDLISKVCQVIGKNNKNMVLDYKFCNACGRRFVLDTQVDQIRHQQIQITFKELQSAAIASNSLPASSKKQKQASEQGKYYGYLKYQYSGANNNICKWPGCTDKAFRNGLCWDHFQHDMGEI